MLKILVMTKSITNSDVEHVLLVEGIISSLGEGVMVGTPFFPGRDIS